MAQVRTTCAARPTSPLSGLASLPRSRAGSPDLGPKDGLGGYVFNEVNTGVYAAPSEMTLGEWLTGSWLPTMRTQIRASTWDSYDRLMRLHVIPTLGHRPLHQLTPPMLNNLYPDLMERGSRRGRQPPDSTPKPSATSTPHCTRPWPMPPMPGS